MVTARRPNAEKATREWLGHHFPGLTKYFYARTGTKQTIPSDVLVDDFDLNIVEWVELGLLLNEVRAALLAELADEVIAEAEVDPQEVYEVAIAGNATMTALLLGVDPEPLGVAPFTAALLTMSALLLAGAAAFWRLPRA